MCEWGIFTLQKYRLHLPWRKPLGNWHLVTVSVRISVGSELGALDRMPTWNELVELRRTARWQWVSGCRVWRPLRDQYTSEPTYTSVIPALRGNDSICHRWVWPVYSGTSLIQLQKTKKYRQRGLLCWNPFNFLLECF